MAAIDIPSPKYLLYEFECGYADTKIEAAGLPYWMSEQ